MHTVLVVEDDPLIRIGAVLLVEEAGYAAVEASNADEAINILEVRSDIHLVFTDVDMPGSMDGVRLARYVRLRWPPVKIIVASGKSIIQESELPIGSRFFPKPYAEHAIATTIREMLS